MHSYDRDRRSMYQHHSPVSEHIAGLTMSIYHAMRFFNSRRLHCTVVHSIPRSTLTRTAMPSR